MATRLRYVIALLVLVPLAASLFVAIHSAATWEQRHMLNSAYQFAIWAEDHAKPRSWREAKHAAEMMEYIESYYVPQEGYRSDPETEKLLARERQLALTTLAGGLKRYTGQDFGTDADAWQEWLTWHADDR